MLAATDFDMNTASPVIIICGTLVILSMIALFGFIFYMMWKD